jgi:choline dehydrogenase-like flavoprotein
MILDADEIEPNAELSAELCIVGGGAAGITLALHFAESGHAVVLLESGGESPEAPTQALYRGHVADPTLHSPPHRFRHRGFGGSTSIWGGRCVPLDPIDLQARPWIAHSGWPIGMAELAPHYAHANRLCEAGDFAYTAAEAFPGGLPPIIAGFRGANCTDDRLERFSCPTDFARRYRGRLAASRTLRVILHASVTELTCAPCAATVDSLAARSLRGRRFRVRPRRIVLAMGGLEIPRLLLASRGTHIHGLGNAYGHVGRFYMCHIAGTVGALRPTAGAAAVNHGYAIAPDGTYCRRRLALTEAAQQAGRIGNMVARLHHPRATDPAHRTGALSAIALAAPLIGYEYGTRLRGSAPAPIGRTLLHLRNIACDPRNTAGFALHWLRRRMLAARKFPSIVITPKSGVFSLDFHAEQEPNPASRITLAGDRDALGMQRILIDWRPTATDLNTVRTGLRLIGQDLRASGCATLSLLPEEIDAAALRDGAYGGHHIGTARMSHTPREGVVDGNCRVHGLHNLFIAGSAVFPTSGQANPTLTIVALALRLAQRLQAEMRPTQAIAHPPTRVE